MQICYSYSKGSKNKIELCHGSRSSVLQQHPIFGKMARWPEPAKQTRKRLRWRKKRDKTKRRGRKKRKESKSKKTSLLAPGRIPRPTFRHHDRRSSSR